MGLGPYLVWLQEGFFTVLNNPAILSLHAVSWQVWVNTPTTNQPANWPTPGVTSGRSNIHGRTEPFSQNESQSTNKILVSTRVCQKITLTDDLSTVAEGTVDGFTRVDKLWPSLLLRELEINYSSFTGTSINIWEALEINLCEVSHLALLKVERIDFQIWPTKTFTLTNHCIPLHSTLTNHCFLHDFLRHF